jgi:hypothetical protein
LKKGNGDSSFCCIIIRPLAAFLWFFPFLFYHKQKSKRAIEDHFDINVELELELEKKANEELLKVVRDITDLVDIHYIRQKEAKGLGHAIYCAKTFVGNEPFNRLCLSRDLLSFVIFIKRFAFMF